MCVRTEYKHVKVDVRGNVERSLKINIYNEFIVKRGKESLFDLKCVIFLGLKCLPESGS